MKSDQIRHTLCGESVLVEAGAARPIPHALRAELPDVSAVLPIQHASHGKFEAARRKSWKLGLSVAEGAC